MHARQRARSIAEIGKLLQFSDGKDEATVRRVRVVLCLMLVDVAHDIATWNCVQDELQRQLAPSRSSGICLEGHEVRKSAPSCGVLA